MFVVEAYRAASQEAIQKESPYNDFLEHFLKTESAGRGQKADELIASGPKHGRRLLFATHHQSVHYITV